MKKSLALTSILVLTYGFASAASDVAPSLGQCSTSVYISKSELKSDHLKKIIQKKGLRTVSESDLLYTAKTINFGDWIITNDPTLAQGARYNGQSKALQLPMIAADFQKIAEQKQTAGKIINESELEKAVLQFAELDKKRSNKTMTAAEKNITLAQLFSKAFLSDSELSGQTVTLTMGFAPRMAISYHQDSFALEEGYANEKNTIVSGVTISATEMKKRILANLALNRKVSELGENHIMSEAALFIYSVEEAMNGNVLTAAEDSSLLAQAVALLPDCSGK